MQKKMEDAVPQNTKAKAKWAMKLFNDWLTVWRVRLDGIKVLKDVNTFTKSDLDFCLQHFYCDVRKKDGQKYPPVTLKEIASMIQFDFNRSLNWSISLFLDKEFEMSRKVLDAEMRCMAREGLVKPKKKAAVISQNIEEEIWTNGSFGQSNPKQLITTLIYQLGLHLSLRASQEHYDLQFGKELQLTMKNEEQGEYLEYIERVSKNK